MRHLIELVCDRYATPEMELNYDNVIEIVRIFTNAQNDVLKRDIVSDMDVDEEQLSAIIDKARVTKEDIRGVKW